MVMTKSEMLPLGTTLPDFRLPDPNGKLVSLDDFGEAKAYLVVFMCNHCPYVKHVREQLATLGQDCASWKVAMVGVNSNDFEQYPDDSPERMLQEIKAHGYTFPYLVDEAQDVAKAFRAACTPDFYLFDANKKLVYRGQLDDSRPGNDIPPSGADVRAALSAALGGQPVSGEQKPSIGCNIKWKRGNAPEYFG